MSFKRYILITKSKNSYFPETTAVDFNTKYTFNESISVQKIDTILTLERGRGEMRGEERVCD